MSPRTILLAIGLLWSAAPFGDADAQSGGPYDLTWNTIDGGGGRSTGGNLAVRGTIGQPDAGILTGGAIQLAGGFWKGGWSPNPAGLDELEGEEVPGGSGAPLAFRLYPNMPNPFGLSTSISFDLPQPARVRVEIYDLQGARVKSLVDASMAAGRHVESWDGTDNAGMRSASGIYFFASRRESAGNSGG